MAESAPPPAAAGPGFLRKHAAKLVASVIITAGIVFTLQKGGLTLVPRGVSFQNVRWWTVPAYMVTFTVMNYFRATRWRFLLRSFADVPARRVLAVSWIGFAAILLMPFRLGELVRPYMIRGRRGGAAAGGSEPPRISLSSATGTIVAERVVDGLYLSALLALALVFVPHIDPLPERVVGLPISVAKVRASGFLMLFVFAAAFATIAVFYFARDFARRATLAVFGIVSPRLAEKLAGLATKLADGLHFLGRSRDAGPFFLETTAYWLVNALGMWLLLWGAGVVHADGSAPTFGETCALMGMLGVTILIPGPPGLLGTFQAGIYAGMTMYYPTEVVTGAGAGYVFLLYLLQLGCTTLSAAFFLVSERGALKALQETPLADPQAAP